MFLKTFIFTLGIAFVLANPIQEIAETKVEEDNGHNLIEVDESKNPTLSQESKVEENESAKPFTTESPIEKPVKDQEEEEVEEEEEKEEEITENAPLSSSAEQVTEEVAEVTTEQSIPSSTEKVTEEVVAEVTTEQPLPSSTEQVTEEEVEVTTEQLLTSSTEQVTEEVVEGTTEAPTKKPTFGEKIKDWFGDVKDKLKEEWQAIKNKFNNLG